MFSSAHLAKHGSLLTALPAHLAAVPVQAADPARPIVLMHRSYVDALR